MRTLFKNSNISVIAMKALKGIEYNQSIEPNEMLKFDFIIPEFPADVAANP